MKTFKLNGLKKIWKLTLCTTIAASALALGALTDRAAAATPETLALIDNGKNFIGTPYKYGAPVGITYAFDCSSFTQYMFAGLDVDLPRTASSQASVGSKVAKTDLSVGDLVFFKTNGKSISHVAIYAGSSKILHSSSSQGVTISNMDSAYWKKYYVTARRVVS
ncbi:C40 family peptidase [Paenibacillus sp. NPDC058174]|uniref:C40 family peptidase n=1 Tax=Paenibacillus sp. NPDC058174 TaxID=3346366 RepID=UPI0036DA6673